MLLCHPYIITCEVSITILYLFLKIELFPHCCKSFCVFWGQVLCQICGLQVFLPTGGVSFYYLISRFHRAHGFNCKNAVAVSENSLPNPRSPRFSPIFSSSFIHFIAICFIFNPFYF